MTLKPLLLAASALTLTLSTAACKMNPDTTVAAEVGTEVGIDKAAMDSSVKPGDDFYAYANGNWMKANEIPADRSGIGAFLTAFLSTEAQLDTLMKEILANEHEAGSTEAMIKAYYEAYMDVAAIEAAGLAPVKADLDRFAAVSDVTSLSRVIGEQLQADVDPLNATDYNTPNLFGIFVSQGLKTPGENVPYLLQGGLGLPDRDYYLSGDADMAAIRKDYRAHVETMFTLAGMDQPAARADRVIALETAIAKAHVGREVSEDMAKGATIWTTAELKKNAPGIDWDALLGAADLDGASKFDIYQKDAIPALSKLVASQPLAAWKDWLAYHQLSDNADVLPAKFDQANFAFYGTRLNGTQAQRPRDKRVLTAIQGDLGYALGKLYVERNFPAEDKAQIAAMVDNIKSAFATRVEKLDWMAASTKKEAIAKVTGMEVGIGYPDTWPSYDGMNVAASAYANRQAARDKATAQQLAKIGEEVDRGEWWMVPQLVNAVNLPVQNALNFPAAILQRPFYDPKADPAFNYGAIGAVIGHEIVHSFDNNGALFDRTGALRNWWTDEDLAKFGKAGDALVAQYDAYAPFPGVNVNGKLTLGENIADLAGLAASYDAYRASLGGKEAPVIDGLTGDQRFFIAYAQAWATKMRDESLKARIANDGHAPGNYRALTVRNLDAWYDAFGVKEGDALYLAPEERVRIW